MMVLNYMENKITKLEITMAELKTKISYIVEALDENKEQHKEIIRNQEAYMREMREFVEQVIAEKADKWVENFLLKSGAIVGTAILLGIITLVAKAYIHLNK
jgi:flagellar biosynthesis chaperone FliJ